MAVPGVHPSDKPQAASALEAGQDEEPFRSLALTVRHHGNPFTPERRPPSGYRFGAGERVEAEAESRDDRDAIGNGSRTGTVPVERIELPTFGLQNRCTTAVLHRRTPGNRCEISRSRSVRSVFDYGSGPAVKAQVRAGP